MAAWGRYTGEDFAPVSHRAGIPETAPPAPRASIIGRLAGQHRRNRPVVRARFGSGDFRLLPAFLGVVVALVLAGLAAGSLLAWPVVRDARSHLILGERLAGLSRIADDGGEAVAVWKSFGRAVPDLTNVVAGSYQDRSGQRLSFTIVAGKRLTLRPQELNKWVLRSLAQHDEPIDYSTGKLGGYTQCAAATADTYQRTYCLWVDHGTVGFAVFYRLSVSESAEMFGRVRQEAIVR
jgi:hypothetical protein